MNHKWLVIFLIFHVMALLSSIAVLTITSALSIVYLVVFLIQQQGRSGREKLLISEAWPIFAIYLGVTLVSAIMNWEYIRFRDSLVEFRWILSFIAFTLILRKVEIKESAFKVFYVLLIVIGIYSLYQAITGFDIMRGLNKYPMGPYYRATAFFSNPIRFSNVLLVYFSFLLSLVFFDFKFQKIAWFKILALVGTTTALIAANARGAWIAVPIVIFTIAAFYSKKLLISSFLVLSIFTGAVYIGSPYFKDRVDSIFELDHPQTSPRKIIWRVYTDIWLDHPIFGVGVGRSGKIALERATAEEVQEVRAIGAHAHNQLLNVLSEQGLFAGLALLAIFAYFLWIGIKAIRLLPTTHFYRTLCIGAVGALVSLIITGITESNLVLNEVTNNFVLVIAIIQICYWLANKRFKYTNELPS